MNNHWRAMDRKAVMTVAKWLVPLLASVFFCVVPPPAHAQTGGIYNTPFEPDCAIDTSLLNGTANTVCAPGFDVFSVQFTSVSFNNLVIQSGQTIVQTTDLTLGMGSESYSFQVCGLCLPGAFTNYDPNYFDDGGTYDLQSGTLRADSQEIVATFNQTGGANVAPDNFLQGDECVSGNCFSFGQFASFGDIHVNGGNYNLSGGTVWTTRLQMDDGGLFNQSGGSVTILPTENGTAGVSGLYVGGGSNGTYTLSAGTLQVGGISNSANSPGADDTAPGQFNPFIFQGGQSASVQGNEYIGFSSASNGVFNQSGGTNQLGQYNDPTNPLNGSTGGNLYVGYRGTGTYNQSGGTLANILGTNEYIGYAPGSTGTFNQTGGENGLSIATGGTFQPTIPQLLVGVMGHGSYTLGTVGGGVFSAILTAGDEEIGMFGFDGATGQIVAGTGTFVQNSGSNLASELFVGDRGSTFGGNFSALNPQGIYTLNGGLVSASFEAVGFESVGLFVQNGGINQTQSLTIAEGTSQNFAGAAYALYGGTLTVCCSSESIGVDANSDGIFNQSGGLNQTTQVIVGSVGQGSYSLSGGELDGSNLTVGESGGTGLFEQSGGVVDLLATFQSGGATRGGTGSLQVGSDATGTYDLGCALSGGVCTPGTGSLNAGLEQIGLTVNTSFVGTFNQYAGTTNTVTFNGEGNGSLIVGESGQGVYNQFGGTLTANIESIAAGGSTGTFNQSGGTNNVVPGTPGSGVLIVGDGGIGTYNLSGPSTGPGATTLNAVNENIGFGGVGNFNQSGGVNNVSGTLIVGDGSFAGPQGFYTQSGGVLNAANEIVGNNSGSTSILAQGFIQTGGTNTVSGTLTVGGSPFNQSAFGLYGLENGTLTAQDVIVGGKGVFSINPTSAPNQAGAVTLLVAGTLTNNGTINFFSGPSTTITANITNLVNNGAINVDPVTLNLGNVTIGTNGYFNGTPGDVINVSGIFISTSTQGSLWNTASVTLDFGTGSHDVLFSSGSSATMFNWGALVLDAGSSLVFGLGSGGLYTDAITLGTGSGFCGGNIFYDVNDAANSFLNGATDTFSCSGGLTGELIPFSGAIIGPQPVSSTPEPGTWVLLLSGLAMLGFLKRTGRLDFDLERCGQAGKEAK